MDVMRPERNWVDGCCFRINFLDQSTCLTDTVSCHLSSIQECEDETEFISFAPIENCHVTMDESGKYTAALNLASAYFPVIIGTKGATRKRLEAETRTHIQIPKMGQDGIIKIKGTDRVGVSSACRRIGLIVMSFRQRQPFTHFVSLSVAGGGIQKSFLQFKKEVMELCGNESCVNESLFQHELKLHMTLGTMVLLDNVEREQASEALQGVYTEVVRPLVEGNSLQVHLKGLEYMNDDPTAVDVLYAKVVLLTDGSAAGCILQDIADGVVDYFSRRGLMKKDHERVKLHVTLMNTLFRKEDTVGNELPSKDRSCRRDSFDATPILKNFQNYNFGVTIIDSIQLSQRYSTGKDGYYQCTAKVDLK